jgi:hypothetical protein
MAIIITHIVYILCKNTYIYCSKQMSKLARTMLYFACTTFLKFIDLNIVLLLLRPNYYCFEIFLWELIFVVRYLKFDPYLVLQIDMHFFYS